MENQIAKTGQVLEHVIKASFIHTAIFLLDPEHLRFTLNRRGGPEGDGLPPHVCLTQF